MVIQSPILRKEERCPVIKLLRLAQRLGLKETYTDFSDYLKKNVYIPDESRQYSFYDLTGDGVDELLLGQDGAFFLSVPSPAGSGPIRVVST